MTEADFTTRVLAAVDGYWHGATLTANVRKAWLHLLAPHHIDLVIDALGAYAAERHPLPPRPGQLLERIQPSDPNKSFRMSVEGRRREWLEMLCEMARGGDNRALARIPNYVNEHPELAELVPADLRPSLAA